MYDRETVELALYAVEDGMSRREAAELAGCTVGALRHRLDGRIPHERAARGRIEGRPRREERPADDSKRAVYEAAMTEKPQPLEGARPGHARAARGAPRARGGDPLGPRLALQDARLGGGLRLDGGGQAHVPEGALAGQRRLRGLLRQAEGGALPPARLGAGRRGASPGRSGDAWSDTTWAGSSPSGRMATTR